eukprot:492279_1
MTNSGSINSSFGHMKIMPLGRQKTNETYGVSNQSSTGSICLHCSLDSKNCKHNNDGFNYGESNNNNNPNKLIYDEYYLKRNHPSRIRGNRNIKQFKSQMRRRTFWEDLFDLLKQYCCCCLFGGCCCSCTNDSCCEEWWYYCCGCCCSDSYLRDDYNNNNNNNNLTSNNIQSNIKYERYNSQQSTGSSNTPYSNYHIDLNNNSKYQIIHEDSQPIKLELNDENNNNNIKNSNNGNDLKHSLISNVSHNNSIGGVHVEHLKPSIASQYDHKFTIKNTE